MLIWVLYALKYYLNHTIFMELVISTRDVLTASVIKTQEGLELGMGENTCAYSIFFTGLGAFRFVNNCQIRKLF